MYFSTTKQAWAALKAAKLNIENFICVPDHNNPAGGWLLAQANDKPLTHDQETRLRSMVPNTNRTPDDEITRAPITKAPERKTPSVARTPSPKQTNARTNETTSTRTAGATTICKDLAAQHPELLVDKATFINACVKAGVIESTAGTQWYRLRTKGA